MSPIIWVISYESYHMTHSEANHRSVICPVKAVHWSLIDTWSENLVQAVAGPNQWISDPNPGHRSDHSNSTRLDNIRIKISNSGGQSCRKWSNWYYINVAFDWLTLWQILEDSSNFFFPKFEFFVSENPIDFRKTSQCEFHEHLLNFL